MTLRDPSHSSRGVCVAVKLVEHLLGTVDLAGLREGGDEPARAAPAGHDRGRPRPLDQTEVGVVLRSGAVPG